MVNEVCKVVEHTDMGSGYRQIVFDAPKIAADAQPGQFVHLRVPALEASALRRPFSIFNADAGRLELLYKTVGRGTAALNAVKPGDEVSVMGPLGHGFPQKCDGASRRRGLWRCTALFPSPPSAAIKQSNNQTIKQFDPLRRRAHEVRPPRA